MVTAADADALDTLAAEIVADSSGEWSPDFDKRLGDLIRGPMLDLQGRTLVAARYTLNITNALQLRAKGWYIRGLIEIAQPGQPYAGLGLEHIVDGNVVGGTSATGASIGKAACAAIARCWAKMIRQSLGLEL